MCTTHIVPAGAPHIPSQGNLLEWADKALGQGISSVTRGVKNLLSGARQAPVAAALEALMEGKQVGVWDRGEGGGRGCPHAGTATTTYLMLLSRCVS